MAAEGDAVLHLDSYSYFYWAISAARDASRVFQQAALQGRADTMSHPYAPHWDTKNVENVPMQTGASALMDGRDIRALAEDFGLSLPFRNVLDVGCGTGRASQLCQGYLGVDISHSAIAYCKKEGIRAHLINGADQLPSGPFDTILCLSVFTHIGRMERRDYLSHFYDAITNDGIIIADVILGDGEGDVACWTTHKDDIAEDFAFMGFDVVASKLHQWDTHEHLYFLIKGRKRQEGRNGNIQH